MVLLRVTDCPANGAVSSCETETAISARPKSVIPVSLVTGTANMLNIAKSKVNLVIFPPKRKPPVGVAHGRLMFERKIVAGEWLSVYLAFNIAAQTSTTAVPVPDRGPPDHIPRKC